MKDCQNCGKKGILFGGVNDGDLSFCSKECWGFYQHKGFCDACLTETSEEHAGNSPTVNGIGARLHGVKNPCGVCHSVIQSYSVCVLFIPIIPMGKYRILYTSPNRYYSRKLKPTQPP